MDTTAITSSHATEEKAPATPAPVIKIDIDGVLVERLPGMSRFIPRAAVNWLKRTVCQDRLNQLLEENAGLEGADFCRGIFRSLGISFTSVHEERLPDASHRRVLYVSNHPLGGLDGMALIQWVQQRHGGRVWFVVNDLLTAVKPLEGVFLPVNKFGRQSREAIRAVDAAFDGDDPVIMFPAGLVSRLQKVEEGGCTVKKVCDLKWNKMFVGKARQSRRDVIPLFFSGHNSMHFYRMANLRRRLGIKFNFEMILLPGEMCRMEGASLSVVCGKALPWQSLPRGHETEAAAARIRSIVYSLATTEIQKSNDTLNHDGSENN